MDWHILTWQMSFEFANLITEVATTYQPDHWSGHYMPTWSLKWPLHVSFEHATLSLGLFFLTLLNLFNRSYHKRCLDVVCWPIRQALLKLVWQIRHSSHDSATQSSHFVDRAGWQAKMASIDLCYHDVMLTGPIWDMKCVVKKKKSFCVIECNGWLVPWPIGVLW